MFIAATTAALMATVPFAAAKKPDPALIVAVASASTTEIEEIVVIGINIGTLLASNTITLNATNVSALVGGLTDAIITKRADTLIPDPNRLENKIDEVGEVAAYVFAAISGNKKVTSNLGQAKKYATAVTKSALESAIKRPEFRFTDIIADVVGSVAQTIHADSRYDVLEVKLQKTLLKSAARIAGKKNKQAVVTALNMGFTADPLTSGLENGNDQAVAQITDPETDFRNS